MSWLILGLISVFFLGIYDLAKKWSVQNNAVLPVLFYSTLAGFLFILPILGLSLASPNFIADFGSINLISYKAFSLIFIKGLIVASSWGASYIALKHLPLSLASPIRASQPIWTVLGALILFGEQPSFWQFLGLAIVLLSYFGMALSSKSQFSGQIPWKWFSFMLFAALMAACSSFFDKYLLQNLNISPLSLQFYFSMDLLIIIGIAFAIFYKPKIKKQTPFVWRWSIPCIGFLLLCADLAYFYALHIPGAMVSVLSPMRRGNAVISFVFGVLILKESLNPKKGFSILGILVGMCLLILGGE